MYVAELWILAAQFEVEVMKSVENARSLMLRGIRFNLDSQQLRHEVFVLLGYFMLS